jgi:hypothetical protein
MTSNASKLLLVRLKGVRLRAESKRVWSLPTVAVIVPIFIADRVLLAV